MSSLISINVTGLSNRVFQLCSEPILTKVIVRSPVLQIDLAELGDYVEHFDAKTLVTEPVSMTFFTKQSCTCRFENVVVGIAVDYGHSTEVALALPTHLARVRYSVFPRFFSKKIFLGIFDVIEIYCIALLSECGLCISLI